jgi:hypothetical protein
VGGSLPWISARTVRKDCGRRGTGNGRSGAREILQRLRRQHLVLGPGKLIRPLYILNKLAGYHFFDGRGAGRGGGRVGEGALGPDCILL